MMLPFCLSEIAGNVLSIFAEHLSLSSLLAVIFDLEGWLFSAIRGLRRLVSEESDTRFLQSESMSILKLL